MQHDIYLLLGSNLGNRPENLQKAKDALARMGEIVQESSVFKTEPWKMETDDWFYNQVLHFRSNAKPEELMSIILKIESDLGRTRKPEHSERYVSRLIDIDILYFDSAVIDDKYVTIPHPKIQERRFVLAPMVELAPGFVHPLLGQTQFELLKSCPDDSLMELV